MGNNALNGPRWDNDTLVNGTDIGRAVGPAANDPTVVPTLTQGLAGHSS